MSHWTPAEDRRLRELFAEGLNDRKIAIRLCCTANMVSRRRRTLGLIRKDCRGNGVPEGPTDPVACGSAIDAMFRAAERPSIARSTFRQLPPQSLLSRGEAMT